MPWRAFTLSAAAAVLTNLLLHVAFHFLFLKDLFAAYPAGPDDFVRQLVRPADQLVGWALAVSAVTMGLLIATVMRWSGARTFASGLKDGALLGFLFWASVNFGLFASSHHFSLAITFVDSVSSGAVMALSSAVAAAVLGRTWGRARG